MEKVETKQSNQRVVWVDWCRAFAICCVLLCHTTERVYWLNLPGFGEYPLIRQVFSLTMFTIGRLGVPVFFMISGYLLLDRAYDYERSKRFYRNNLLGLVLTTEIWIVIYNLFNVYFYGYNLDFEVLIRNMLFVKNTEMTHMWYMPVIIGLYMFIPFAANALQHTDGRILRKIIAFAFIWLFIIPEINVILYAEQEEALSALIDLSYSGGCYGVYIATGYFWKKGYFDKIPTFVFPIAFLVCFPVTVWVQLFSFQKGVGYGLWYNNATLFIAAFSIFAFMARQRSIKDISAIRVLAFCSFGLYLIHNPVNMMLSQYFNIESCTLRLAIIFTLTLVISWVGVYILSRSKRIGRVLFFMK